MGDRALFNQCTSLIAEHIHRARTITISVPNIFMPDNFDVPAPNMEHLYVVGTRLARARELFGGHMPKLGRLVLESTDISTFPGGLSELEELKLNHVYGIHEPLKVDSLHQILSLCPCLERLAVHGIINDSPRLSPLHLPYLETLILTAENLDGGFRALSIFSDLPSSSSK